MDTTSGGTSRSAAEAGSSLRPSHAMISAAMPEARAGRPKMSSARPIACATDLCSLADDDRHGNFFLNSAGVIVDSVLSAVERKLALQLQAGFANLDGGGKSNFLGHAVQR